jgi:hypothetical protein
MTLPQPQGLGKLPLQFLLKNEVSVTREQMAAAPDLRPSRGAQNPRPLDRNY